MVIRYRAETSPAPTGKLNILYEKTIFIHNNFLDSFATGF